MSGGLLIGRDKLSQVLDANRTVLEAATELIALARQQPDLRERLQPVISQLVTSGTLVNTAIASVGGITLNARGK